MEGELRGSTDLNVAQQIILDRSKSRRTEHICHIPCISLKAHVQ